MAVVRVTGVPETVRALRYLEPATRSELNKSLNAVGRDLAGRARGEVPGHSPLLNLKNWRAVSPAKPSPGLDATGRPTKPITRGGAGWPPWVPDAAKGGITSGRTTVSKSQVSVKVTSGDAAAMIYEKAGTKTDGRTPQGRAFIGYLPAVSKSTGGGKGRSGRALIRALKAGYAGYMRDVDDAVDKAVEAVERLMP